MRLAGSERGAYRGGPKPKPEQPPVRELGRVRRTHVGAALILALYATVVGIAAAAAYRRVAVSCSRSSARDLRCAVESKSELWGTVVPSTFDLRATSGFGRATISTGSGKNRRVYDRLFAEAETRRTYLVDGRDLGPVQAKLQAFLVDPSQPTVSVVAEQRTLMTWFAAVALSLMLAAVVLGLFVSTTVVFVGGRVRIERRRGPWRAVEELRLTDIARVLEQSRMVVFERRDGTTVPLFQPGGSQLAELVALLERARASGS